MGHKTTTTVLIVVVVSITALFLCGVVVSGTPNPQPGGPSAGFRLVPPPRSETLPLVAPLRPARLG